MILKFPAALSRPVLAAASVLLLSHSPARAQSPVPEGSSPASFAAAAKHLEIGGLFFSYMDLDGDLAKLAAIGDKLLEAARKDGIATQIPDNLKAAPLVDALGLTSLKGLGFSSRSLGPDFFHNRALLVMPGGGKGLLKLFGNKPAPVEVASFAPKDADIAYQGEFTLSALRETMEAVLTAGGDENMLAQFKGLLDFPIPPLNMTAGEVIEQLNLKVMTAASLKEDRKFNVPGAPVAIPAVNAMVSIEGLDFIMEALLVFAGETDSVTVEKGDGFNIIKPVNALPGELDYFRPALYHDVKSKKIILTTHIDYARAAIAGTDHLKDSPDFQKATSGLPAEANGMTYASAKFLKVMSGLSTEIMKSTADANGGPGAGLAKAFSKIASELSPTPNQGIAGTYSHVPEGMLFLSNTMENHKHTLVQAAAVPLGIAAAAFGANSNVAQALGRARGGAPAEDAAEETPDNDPAAPNTTVRSNLQQVAFAAQTWFIDNPSAKEVTYEQLVAAELLFDITPAFGEQYKGLKLSRTGGRVSVKLKDGDDVSFAYPAVTD